MIGLRKETINQCFIVLADCIEFTTQAYLKSLFFNLELSPYENRLPEAENVDERVYRTIEYLLRQHKDAQGRWVFLSFLGVLKDRYGMPHGKRQELENIFALVENELCGEVNGIEIPFVTLSMTNSEAKELFTDPQFRPIQGVEQNGFSLFVDSLLKSGDDLLSHYGALRDHWKPYTSVNEDTRIEALVKCLLEDVNISRRVKGLPQEYATFYTQGFFENDVEINNFLYDQGCIVIADVLSLFHPNVFNILDQSVIRNRKDKVAMMVLSPDTAFKTPINIYIEEFLKMKMKWHYVVEFEQHLLRLYEFNVGDLRTFKKRLFTMLPETVRILQSQEPDPEVLASLAKLQRTNIGGLLFKEKL